MNLMVLSKRASQKQGEESRCWSKLKHTWARIIKCSGIAGQFWREEGGQMHTLRVRLFRGRCTLSGQCKLCAQGIAMEKKTFLMLVIFLMRQ